MAGSPEMLGTTGMVQQGVAFRKGEIPVFTPMQFADAYTQFYRNDYEDSPDASRSFLVGKLVDQMTMALNESQIGMISVLSVGAGRQVVEAALKRHPQWANLSPFIQLVTMDIAKLQSSQLLTSDIPHITTDGSQLPFGDHSFDIVYSNMAIDFMPRSAFSESARVLKPEGVFLANLHHPNLIDTVISKEEDVRRQMRTVNQKFTHGRMSRSLDANREKYDSLRERLETIRFITTSFPHLIFNTSEEIGQFFSHRYAYQELKIEEYDNRSANEQNGWFYVEVKGLQEKTE